MNIKKFVLNHKKIFMIVSIVILILIIALIAINNANNWKNKFEITYVGKIEKNDSEYYSYDIKNITNNTLSNVIAVLEVKCSTGRKYFKFEYPVAISIKAGETKNISVSWDEIKDYAEYYNVKLLFSETNIIKIKYNGKPFDYTTSHNVKEKKEKKKQQIVENIDNKLGGNVEINLNDLITYIEDFNNQHIIINGNIESISNDYKTLKLSDTTDKTKTIDVSLYEEYNTLKIGENVYIRGSLNIYNGIAKIYAGKLNDSNNSGSISIDSIVAKATNLSKSTFKVSGTIISISENNIEFIQEQFKGFKSFKIGKLDNINDVKIYDDLVLNCKMDSLDYPYFDECSISK